MPFPRSGRRRTFLFLALICYLIERISPQPFHRPVPNALPSLVFGVCVGRVG